MATSQSQIQEGTALQISGVVGADYAWSVEGLTNNAGRVSAQIDLGADPRDPYLQWWAEAQWQATPTQYKTLDIYAAIALNGFASDVAGDVGTSDAALGDVDQLRQFGVSMIGQIVVEDAGTTVMRSGGWFFYPYRYLSLIAYNNNTGATLNATDSNFDFQLVPFNFQGQAT